MSNFKEAVQAGEERQHEHRNGCATQHRNQGFARQGTSPLYHSGPLCAIS